MRTNGTNATFRQVITDLQSVAAKATGDNQAVLNGLVTEFDHLAEWGGDNSLTREEVLAGLKALAEKSSVSDSADVTARRKALAQVVAAANWNPPARPRWGLSMFASALASALAMAAENKKSAHPDPVALAMAANYPREITELIFAALS